MDKNALNINLTQYPFWLKNGEYYNRLIRDLVVSGILSGGRWYPKSSVNSLSLSISSLCNSFGVCFIVVLLFTYHLDIIYPISVVILTMNSMWNPIPKSIVDD